MPDFMMSSTITTPTYLQHMSRNDFQKGYIGVNLPVSNPGMDDFQDDYPFHSIREEI